MFSVRANSMLYRAAPVVETKPKPKFCHDTWKNGVYFSLNHPYLAETMCLEYGSDLVISVYKTTRPFHVIIGKYTSSTGSHYDQEIEPVETTNCEPVGKYFESNKCAELFLDQSDLSKIEYIGCYFMTYRNARARWQ